MRQRYAILLAALFVLAACSDDGRVDTREYEPTTHGKAKWTGTYLTTPKHLVELQGKGLVTLRFLRDSRVEINVSDDTFPNLLWVADARIRFEGRAPRALRCERAVIFRIEKTGKQVSLAWRKEAGDAEGDYLQTDSSGDVARLLSDASLLSKELPKDLRECTKNEIGLARTVIGRGNLELHIDGEGEKSSLLLDDATNPDFIAAIDSLPHPTPAVESWASAAKFPELEGAKILADARNRLVPSAPAHRYYVLPRFQVAADSSDVRLEMTRASRPDPKKTPLKAFDCNRPFVPSDKTRTEIAPKDAMSCADFFEASEARWTELEAKSWRVQRPANPSEGKFENDEKARAKALSVDLGALGNGDGTLEVGYELPDHEWLWESVASLSANGVKPLETPAFRFEKKN